MTTGSRGLQIVINQGPDNKLQKLHQQTIRAIPTYGLGKIEQWRLEGTLAQTLGLQ